MAAKTLLALSIVAIADGPARAEPPQYLDVVELFTSQSCSACPPADELLGELAKRNGILALSYSVDYWDYLEWKDTLADPSFSARQRRYAKSRGDRKVYTPQMIVNGRVQTIGSKAYRVEAALAEAAWPETAPRVPLAVTRPDASSIAVEVGPAPDGMDVSRATLWLVAFEEVRTVEVKAGENKGRILTYHNAVRRIEPLGEWTGDKLRLSVALPELAHKKCAVLLQEGDEKRPGAILAAVRLSERRY